MTVVEEVMAGAINKACERCKNYEVCKSTGCDLKADLEFIAGRFERRPLERKCFMNGNIYYVCPRCGCTQDTAIYKKEKWCRECGQHLEF